MSTYREPGRGELIAKIDDRTAKVVVVGQGYVGLPVAMRAVEVGFPVVGYDIAPERIEALAAGRSYVEDVTDEQLASALAAGYLPDAATRPTSATSTSRSSPCRRRCARACPTSRSSRRPARDLAACLTPGALVVLESTTYPGHHRRAAAPDPRGVGAARRRAATSSSATRPSASTPATREWTFVNTRRSCRASTPRRSSVVEAFYGALVDKIVPVALDRRGRAREAAREHVPAREHRARQRARDVRPRPRRRHLVGDRRRGDEAVRLHALHARARRRRPLPPDRPVVPRVARRAAARSALPLRRARQRRQPRHARVRRRARRRDAQRRSSAR